MRLSESVSNVMTPSPITATREITSGRLRELFRENRFTMLPIVGPDQRLEGIITATDVLAAGLADDETVGSLIGADVVSVKLTSSIAHGARTLSRAGVHHLVVVDDDERPVGVLSVVDVLRTVGELDYDHPISTVMSEEVLKVDIGTTVASVSELLAEAGVSSAAVEDGAEIVGAVSAEQLLSVTDDDEQIDDHLEAILWVDSSETLSQVAALLIAEGGRRAYVRDDDGELVGVVSTTDLTGYVASISEELGEF
ncbi:MAG: CBS domain-containing protein [Myxococcales bacterium]|nr:CBS domain-containing protein [Myxococcales bacterium]